MTDRRHRRLEWPARLLPTVFLAVAVVLAGCNGKEKQETLRIPHGYVDRLVIDIGDRLMFFGPFVGYYFKPSVQKDFSRLQFVCFNERQFYTKDLPENAALFTGEARWTRLPADRDRLPQKERINPVFFDRAPKAWLATRPEPVDLFVHFHSCYDARGPLRSGYWLRHEGVAHFTYDMGGRVGKESPLYHEVGPGPDRDFARIVEFDRGPR